MPEKLKHAYFDEKLKLQFFFLQYKIKGKMEYNFEYHDNLKLQQKWWYSYSAHKTTLGKWLSSSWHKTGQIIKKHPSATKKNSFQHFSKLPKHTSLTGHNIWSERNRAIQLIKYIKMVNSYLVKTSILLASKGTKVTPIKLFGEFVLNILAHVAAVQVCHSLQLFSYFAGGGLRRL